MAKGDGLILCEEAFQRLQDGRPQIKAHVGLRRQDITPSIVSVEAGYDKGYLKKSRPLHQPLIAQIYAYAEEGKDEVEQVDKAKLDRLSQKYCELAEERGREAEILQKVLSQNIMLVERVRELERRLSRMAGSNASWRI